MEAMITERRAFIAGQSPGRAPGVPNKTTRERTELFRKKLDENNLLFKLINQIEADIESGQVSFKDKINALKTIAPYLV
ncbi:hypothetical protein CTP45_24595, partial [Salmonella enterica]|nr:hypothetical protein [Salmonella enterica]EEJ5577663.1 hypothetical protein [Salmonella enterica subsp. enterica serovar Saintpaul]EBB1215435.1 hypothetical protein [Salmonella enterica]EBC2471342.1 hypothetical protein [Salmonella enterica]EBI8092934.1 hypothetical protein [Salmonella enterica]